MTKINIGLSNFIEFLNVELKEDVLLKFQVPLVITEGRIGKLSIKINMPSNNSEIKVENVLIRVSSLRESRTNYARDETDGISPEVVSSDQTDFKTQLIKDWEAKTKKYFEGSSKFDIDIKSATWIKTTVENLVQNIKLDVSHVVVWFQVDTWIIPEQRRRRKSFCAADKTRQFEGCSSRLKLEASLHQRKRVQEEANIGQHALNVSVLRKREVS